jgi:hypothetical protein
MKGRRKFKTQKWELKAKFETDARLLSDTKSRKPSRFLDRALKQGREFEPIGLLAGPPALSK